jgi:hypothetical protein
MCGQRSSTRIRVGLHLQRGLVRIWLIPFEIMGRGNFSTGFGLDCTLKTTLIWVGYCRVAWTTCGKSKLAHRGAQKGRKKGDSWAASAGPRGKEKKKARPAEVLA